MEGTEESFDNILQDCEDQSENSQVNDNNFPAVVSDHCESVDIKEEECDVHVSDTGENSVDNTAQSNPNMYSRTADKRFKCNICCKSFASKQSVTTHSYQHNIEKPFKCNICSKSFCEKYPLITHLRIHNNEKPFKCSICDKSFSQKSILTKHLHIHGNEKLFKCNICCKSFSQKYHLTRHLSIHTN